MKQASSLLQDCMCLTQLSLDLPKNLSARQVFAETPVSWRKRKGLQVSTMLIANEEGTSCTSKAASSCVGNLLLAAKAVTYTYDKLQAAHIHENSACILAAPQ